MSWLGIDDTDSPSGGCTTHVLTEVIRAAGAAGIDLIGYPRLVRLNPNAPGRTRGNAALSARFGVGTGPPKRIGEFPDGPLLSFPSGAPLSVGASRELLEVAWKAVLAGSRIGEAGTDPALVIVPSLLPSSLYWEAVRTQIDPAKVESLVQRNGGAARSEGSGEGIVGAAAAVSWRAIGATWELIAYRSSDATGARRPVSASQLAQAERRYPELFQCQDLRTRRVLVSPHTPCPILYGLRATVPDRLPKALELVAAEPIERWAIFQTNQGTGDHLSHLPLGTLRPYSSAQIHGVVADAPTVVRGGHWKFHLLERVSGEQVECIAFEPTKTLPRLVRQLRQGDSVRAWGGIAEGPTFRLEGIELLRTVPRTDPAPNPRCPDCGARARSLGASRGFRCVECRRKFPPESRAIRTDPAAPKLGTYHPTPSARRHLAPRAPETADGRSSPLRLLRRARTDLYR
ncbi:MAG: tRNA(Ile)(2)-agmatinylcytidine synthase [Thermoplasmata archaeon]|nr:tRNA(Ile)(2)-agmatinylcytidine synthase [Thermoplasmata archaeon]